MKSKQLDFQFTKYETGMKNIVDLYSKARIWEIELGLRYYWDLHTLLSRYKNPNCCIDMRTVVGVFAALSPNNSESGNITDTKNAIYAYSNDDWDSLKVSTYPANKAKARLILSGQDPVHVLKGLKTTSFFHNILLPDNDVNVTVDGHMVNIWRGKRVRLTSAKINSFEYRTIATGLKDVAGRYGLVPCQLQAILWLAWRRIHWIKYNPQLNLDLGE